MDIREQNNYIIHEEREKRRRERIKKIS